ncbi:hypothetical protein O3P69_017575 [Scylla paramamosain]|uniref:Cytochrome-b5 reductase n=1 Tax=Scylla paramamosain TaxID=85552 RepID=A0AAW0TXY1_SCYPA
MDELLQTKSIISDKEHVRYFSSVSPPDEFGVIEIVLRFESHGIMSQHFKALKPGDRMEFQGSLWTDKTNIKLLYFSENYNDILYKEELDKYREQDSRLQVVYTLGEAPEEWEGEEGFISSQMLDKHVAKPNMEKHKIVMCGGPAMIISYLYSLRSLNYPSDFIFIYGQFGTEQVKTVYGRNVKLSTHRCDNVL